MAILFTVIKHTIGLRVTRMEEIIGLDIEEHGLMSSYADFMPLEHIESSGASEKPSVPIGEAVVVEDRSTPSYGAGHPKITKLSVVFKQAKFDEFKAAMNDIGVTGMTLTNVLGCGMQKGVGEYYRGVPLEVTLLPKVKVEIVVCKVPVDTVVEAVKKVLYTGHIGDGKIFIYDVENVVKVRTGEEGYAALQDEV